MMIQKKLTAILSGAALLMTPVCTACAEADTGSPAVEAPVFLSGVVSSADNCTAERTILLDYKEGTVTETIRLVNNGDGEASVDILAPQVVTLASTDSELYTFAGEGTETSRYISAPLSVSNLSETTVTAESLFAARDRDTSLPETGGFLYQISGSFSADNPALTFTLSSPDCHVYPYGCKYTGSEDTYHLTTSDGLASCMLFLTGSEDTDFSVTFSEGAEVTSAESSLSEYLSLCSERFLNEEEGYAGIDGDLLMKALADYFKKSGEVSSPDIRPTLSYIIAQKLFLVDDCHVVLAAGQKAEVTVSRPARLAASAAQLNPALVTGSLDEAQDLTVVFPEGYSTLAVQNTSGKKTDSTSYHITGYKDSSFKVVLYKSFDFSGMLKNLPVFLVIMAVFMGLCLISYMKRKKAAPPKEE